MKEKPSVFTPSNTSPELLEEMFVQRHKLLEKSVKWTEQSILTEKKNHLIYIGPRGSGKTHFITMLINRLKKKNNLINKMLIVWLGEDATITSYLDLALSILQQMVGDYPEQFNTDCLTDIQHLTADNKAKIILASINQQLADKTIVLVKENINQVFRGLKDAGQKSLRSQLQENNNIVLVCTSQLLFKGITSRDAVFFGFFDTYHLKPLNLKQATQLVINIAKYQGKQELIDFINTPQGCYRMRALHYLAGGNHRLYIELIDFLVAESLDNLVEAINDLIEVLTPYFQERMNSLPAQQQKIIQQLCKVQGAIPVKQLAEKMIIIEQRTLAKQLGELKSSNYVISHKRGKQSFYEISEPLMRLSEEIKNAHGKPLKLLVNLIRAWFSDDELQTESMKGTDALLLEYKSAALHSNSDILNTINKQIIEEANEEYDAKNYKEAIDKYSEVIVSPTKENEKIKALFNRGVTYGQQGNFDKAIKDFSKIINSKETPVELVAKALLYRGDSFGQHGNLDKASKDFSKLINSKDASIELIAQALLSRGVTFGKQGNLDKEIKDYTQLNKLKEAPIELVASALINRGVDFAKQDDLDNAIKDFTQLIKLKETPIELVAKALFNRGFTFRQQGDFDNAIKDYTQLINLKEAPIEQVASALLNRGVTSGKQNDLDKEIKDYTQLIQLKKAPIEQVAKALFNRAVAYYSKGKIELSIKDLAEINSKANLPNDLLNIARFLLVELYYQQLNLNKAQDLLSKTLEEGDNSQKKYPTNITDILIAIIKLGSSHWQKEIKWIVELFDKYELLDFLGVGLIKATAIFIEDKSLISSLEKWQAQWQEHANSYEQMQLPLIALKASRLAIEQKSDKPLFELNKETRQLVLEVVEDGIK